MILMLYAVRKQLPIEHNIWLEVGHYTNNTLRYISVDQIDENLGESICKDLPALPVFTGSYYTAFFNKKGKVRPLKLLQNNVDMQDKFSAIESRLEENIDISVQDKI